jgi:RNA polymerase sigma-70 factor (ECF subfamily)
MIVDKKLIEGCIQQKRLAQNELYKTVFSFLMNICIRYKNDYDTAGASLNAIFLKILDNLESFNSENSFMPWIKRIAVNHLIDEFRKNQRERKTVSFYEEVSTFSMPNSRHDKEAEMDSEYLLEMIKELPVMTAKVFNLYAIDGYKHREIAELLEMSENTSKWHLSQARQKLQEKLRVFNENACL